MLNHRYHESIWKAFRATLASNHLYFFFCKIWINICIPYYTPITQSLLTALMASDSVLCGISHVRTDIHTAGCHSATLSGLSAVCCCVYSAPIYCPASPARLFAKLLNTCPSVGKSIVYICIHVLASRVKRLSYRRVPGADPHSHQATNYDTFMHWPHAVTQI